VTGGCGWSEFWRVTELTFRRGLDGIRQIAAGLSRSKQSRHNKKVQQLACESGQHHPI
jgi:hypothetical protein